MLANFFADAAVGFGIEQDFGRVEFLADDGKVLGDARGAGLLLRFFVIGDFSCRSWVCGKGGGSFFCEIASEHKFELFKDEDLGGLARDDLIALCDLITELLHFAADAHLLEL